MTDNPEKDSGATQQPVEPEVLFCNICNQSVPDACVADGRAVRLPDGIAPALTSGGGAGGSRTGGGSSGVELWVAVGILVAALTAGFLFLDKRVTRAAGGEVQAASRVGDLLERQEQRLVKVEESVAGLSASEGFAQRFDELGTRIDAVTVDSAEQQRRIDRMLTELQRQVGEVARKVGEIDEKQLQQQSLGLVLREELRAIARELGEMRSAAWSPAEPRAATPARADGPSDGGAPRDVADPRDSGLPPELMEQVARLADPEDAGVRFAAAEELLAANDPRVLEHVLPLAKDSDVFVRRVVLEGFANFPGQVTIDALMVGLSDPEEIVRYAAYESIRRATGQNFPFDPDARSDQRSSMVRRWQKWWDENRASY